MQGMRHGDVHVKRPSSPWHGLSAASQHICPSAYARCWILANPKRGTVLHGIVTENRKRQRLAYAMSSHYVSLSSGLFRDGIARTTHVVACREMYQCVSSGWNPSQKAHPRHLHHGQWKVAAVCAHHPWHCAVGASPFLEDAHAEAAVATAAAGDVCSGTRASSTTVGATCSALFVAVLALEPPTPVASPPPVANGSMCAEGTLAHASAPTPIVTAFVVVSKGLSTVVSALEAPPTVLAATPTPSAAGTPTSEPLATPSPGTAASCSSVDALATPRAA
mmetsp:Transcript_56070/g.128730  ORF Transcript_56070/g.128730 Transcript_56070/m.128730 type:complete len:278 (-) Transcript_56070:565-1398(-)